MASTDEAGTTGTTGTPGAAGAAGAPAGAGSVTTVADVATDRPGRYGKQLVSHLSRRSPGTWDDAAGEGSIHFEHGRATLRAEGAVLHLAVTTSAESVERLEDVVGRHLVRFATQDRLEVAWVRSDGTPGTHQSGGGAPRG